MSDIQRLDVKFYKVFMLLYADDIVIFSNTAEELQKSFDFLSEYCKRWKLKVNISKNPKVWYFGKEAYYRETLCFIMMGLY